MTDEENSISRHPYLVTRTSSPLSRHVALDAPRSPAVDVDVAAGDHAGARRGEKDGEIGDVLRLDDAAHRHVGDEVLLRLLQGDAALLRVDVDELGPAAGVGRARRDGVDGDAVLAELVRHRLGDGLRAEVDRAAHYLHALRLAPARARNVDDASLRGFAQVGSRLARHADQAERLDREVALPQVVGNLLEPAAVRAAGAVDEDIHATKLGDALLYRW